jgi:hypothetical protein
MAKDGPTTVWHLAADWNLSRTYCGKARPKRRLLNMAWISSPEPKCRDCYRATIVGHILELTMRLT